MLTDAHEPAGFEGLRWKAVRLGLRLANSWLGAGAIGLYYVLWGLIGLLLGLVLIPFVVSGRIKAFTEAMNPIALYGFVLPMALMGAATWGVKLFSRILWCGIPEPRVATLLAYASVAGRLSVLFAAGYLWLWAGPFGKGLLLSETIACSGIAWLGLVAEWGFIRTLRRDFIPPADPAISSHEFETVTENAMEEAVTGQNRKSLFTRHLDPGAWFQRRFPRGHKFVGWVLLPLGYVTLSSLADNGDLRAVPDAILRLAVIAPAILQVFWIPGAEMGRLIDVFGQKTASSSSL